MPKSDVYDALADKGVLASLHIRRPRFEQRLTLVSDEGDAGDLGLHPRNEKERVALEKHVKAGVKLLLPPYYDRGFRSIESSARHTLSRSGALRWNADTKSYESDLHQGYIFAFDTELGPFIPAANLEPWEKKVSEYKERYMALKDELVANYAKVQREVVASYTSIAGGTWARLRKMYPDVLDGSTQEKFVRRYVATIRSGFPSEEEIEVKTVFEWRVLPIGLPQELREAIAEEQSYTKKLKSMVRDSLKADVERVSADLNKQLYSVMWKATADAESAIARGDSLAPKTLVTLEALGDQVRRLNTFENDDVEQWLKRIGLAVEGYRGVKPKEREAALSDLRGALTYVRGASSQRLSRMGMTIRQTSTPARAIRGAIRSTDAAEPVRMATRRVSA